ncbi:ATP-dependent RecD-like DNA helicase [Pajaroellobacter abortibovis]|uniref:AAA+ ATPase domain-containing protein n=1 Tax=Pajaroellobacter abortibovis TaxID=1882918 RepID=A0A1L6MYL1_9BACT|nr:ATP-dependent RecD-like DNA helicase [Pajaroellobacter abortibovis]APS00547.1 hypothetical protein BCY86_07555 [Pajaroellobacter abortibovis]
MDVPIVKNNERDYLDSTAAMVEGEIVRITFENETSSFRVFQMKGEEGGTITVVGILPPLIVGAFVRVRGSWEDSLKYGRRFVAQSIVELAPKTLSSLKRYLGSGRIKGIGKILAQKVVGTFGLRTLSILDQEPHRLAEVDGFGARRIEQVKQAWEKQRIAGELMLLLDGHVLSPSALAVRIMRRYGSRSLEVVARDPYSLMHEMSGVGFLTADRVARGLGISAHSFKRIQAAIRHLLEEQRDQGHTFQEESVLIEQTATFLELPTEPSSQQPIEEALDRLEEKKVLFRERTNPHCTKVFLAYLYHAEMRVAHRVRALLEAPLVPLSGVDEGVRIFQKDTGASFAPEQRTALEEVCRSPVTIVTGGPGVGKTTVMRALLTLFKRAGMEVRLAAPTGRAAKRLSEATGHEAMTLHRLLEFDPRRRAFGRGACCPLPIQALVIDEASMLDLPLADVLFQSILPGTRVVFVGDVDQLPSIGPGRVLGDLIDSNIVPCVRLSRVFRQHASSLIVMNAHRIQAGQLPQTASSEHSLADFFVIQRVDAAAARSLIVELVTKRIPDKFGFDPLRQIQVLTPCHQGPVGVQMLNKTLQYVLNPIGNYVEQGGRIFREGDKVMQLRNDYDHSIWNGDIGWIEEVRVSEKKVRVSFDDGEREVFYTSSMLDHLTLAYACSIHKSQGSEYPAVVMPVLSSHAVFLSRRLLYTGMTRGKQLVVLVSTPRALSMAVAQGRQEGRRTCLLQRLRTESNF